MARILMVGSAMMDLILRCERAPQPSESVLGHDYRNAPGGKGSNAAVAAARAGACIRVSARHTAANTPISLRFKVVIPLVFLFGAGICLLPSWDEV